MHGASVRGAAAATARAAAMAASAFDVLMGKTVKPEPEYWSVIYERTLRWPADPEEPLIGTPYFGQAVRPVGKKYGSAQEVAEARWREEDWSSKRGDGSDACLLEALRMFGPGAFDNRVVEFRRGARESVQAWADERERAEIADHGGTLRTMEPEPGVRQCWNLQVGGKGVAWWKGALVRREKPWKRFLEEMQMYCAAFGSSLVPQTYVAPSGYRLGSELCHCRSRHTFLAGHPDEVARRAALEALPDWSWNVKDDAWIRFLEEMWLYCAAFGSSRVPATYVAPSGYKLGSMLSACRSRHTFLAGHPDKVARRAALEVLPEWTWNVLDDAWVRFLEEMQLYCATFGSARVSQSYVSPSGYNLGSSLNSCRSNNRFLAGHKDEAARRATLEALPGWLWRVSDDADYAQEISAQKAKRISETQLTRSEEQKQEIRKKLKLAHSKRTAEEKAEIQRKIQETAEIKKAQIRRNELELARSVAVPYVRSMKKRAAMRAETTTRSFWRDGFVLFMITKDGKNIARVESGGRLFGNVGPRVDPPATESH